MKLYSLVNFNQPYEGSFSLNIVGKLKEFKDKGTLLKFRKLS